MLRYSSASEGAESKFTQTEIKSLITQLENLINFQVFIMPPQLINSSVWGRQI